MNSFGRIFRLSILGASHDKGVGVLLDGVPPGIPLDQVDFMPDLARRKGGKKGTTPRIEQDLPEIKSGVFNGYTTGSPVMIFFKNENIRSKDYTQFKVHPRPGHADFVAQKKYKGFHDYRGGGHFSGRLTLGIVAAGVVAKKILPSNINISATLHSIGGSQDIEHTLNQTIETGNSVGGLIQCIAENVPHSLGEPFFDSVESTIAHIVFSIPAIKGISFGSGFQLATMRGSEANDCYIDEKGKTRSNHSGGIHGGITNGNPLLFYVAVKPTPSISQPQKTFHFKKQSIEELVISGRHDCCIALRMPVIIEAVTAIALTDLMMIDHGIYGGNRWI